MSDSASANKERLAQLEEETKRRLERLQGSVPDGGKKAQEAETQELENLDLGDGNGGAEAMDAEDLSCREQRTHPVLNVL